MGNTHSIFKDVVNVMASNFVTLLSGVANGLVLPYVLGATYYGYYRIFILYSTYTALLHCGFVDGILLKYSGQRYNDLNKKKFRTYTKIFAIFQLCISIILSMSSLFITDLFYSKLVVLLGIYTFISNMLTYYVFVSQTTSQFGLLSLRNVVQSVLSILLTIICCLIYRFKIVFRINYSTFIYILIFVAIIMLVWYVFTFQDITFGNHYSIGIGISYLVKLCKLGIYLTISYQISNLIMVIDNQFVSSLFKANIYGEYSFSYGISSRALVILGAISTVLLPHLKRDTFKHMIYIYPKIISYMMLVVYLSLIMYFPLIILVKIILPDYINSLPYLKIFLPELGMTCCVTMIIFNYYNALNKSKFYFYMSLGILALSFVINLILYLLFYDPIWIAFGSFISIFIWYVASEYFLIRWYHIKWLKNFIYMILMISSFFIVSSTNKVIVGFVLYLIIYIGISIFMFKTIIFNICEKLINLI